MNTYVAWGGLTKVVTLTPRFFLFNNTHRVIECHANASEKMSRSTPMGSRGGMETVIILEPGAKAPFWPLGSEATMSVV